MRGGWVGPDACYKVPKKTVFFTPFLIGWFLSGIFLHPGFLLVFLLNMMICSDGKKYQVGTMTIFLIFYV